MHGKWVRKCFIIKELQKTLIAMAWKRADMMKEKDCILILPTVPLACRHLVEKRRKGVS